MVRSNATSVEAGHTASACRIIVVTLVIQDLALGYGTNHQLIHDDMSTGRIAVSDLPIAVAV